MIKKKLISRFLQLLLNEKHRVSLIGTYNMLKMCECTGHLAGLQYRNVRVLVWSMREWSGFYNTGMCDC